jgi:hypothetical protein
MIQEKVKVLIVDDDAETSRVVKSMIQVCDEIMVLGGPDQSIVYKLKNYYLEPINLKINPAVKHGAYRKFIKRDKRKNFKVNK